jgi:Amt family ammonium transporter
MDAINSGDTAFVIVSAALVMLMTPGLALFYGGMVRAKNVLGTIMQSFFLVGIASVIWAVFGYSLAFGPDHGGIIGDLSWAGLAGVGVEPMKDYAASIPHLAFMVFQMMFAVITPALITGAFAERMKFKAYAIFMIVWLVLVYSPVAHWVWGVGGWIRTLGALDFAGGTVVHINAAVAALAAVIVMGKRRGLGSESLSPHNLPMTVLGAALLWFGWFGFNAGSALAANGLAASAFVATHLAAATAAISWVVVEWLHRGKPTTLGAASGCVAGLVAITPAAGFVEPMPAILIGLIAGAVCYGGVLLKWRLGYDDSLDCVGVHGFGGVTGALLPSKCAN